ncbi:hypothetical protein A0H81_00861 [Grifola frondosa]|uniref:Zn(2)-C6 fungal-type domain-containing protein n=1 Tax=Grifola frondosa TaxID=5627 RepID=A0A1C7MWW4_GRIFR|nr:hypothetical protein A0H81_00861 [Grifola frondosa]
MPKASSSSISRSASVTATPFQSAQVLRRNQACHQCRRRKLKCDAKRPCSTCVRSHSYAVAHANAGTELPAHPDCTYDDVSGSSIPDADDSPKTRFETLESRINELEALLQEKNQTSSSGSSQPEQYNIASVGTLSSHGADALSMAMGIDFNSTIPAQNGNMPPGNVDFSQFPLGNALDNLAGVASMLGGPSADVSQNAPPSSVSPHLDQSVNQSASTPSSHHSLDLINLSWPRYLPNIDLVRHLAEAFFSYTPGATRVLHAGTFMSALALPPTHPKFPAAGVLHAVCAVGSMYTGAVPRALDHTSPSLPYYDVFSEKYRLTEGRPDSFAEIQIKAAREAIDNALRIGNDLFQCLQAQLIVAWWYWCHAKWSEAYVAFALSLRYAVPCGLNVCPPFNSITEIVPAPALIPPASSVIEDEMRRNTFWVAYMMERNFGSVNGFAMMLDDTDICQLLPLRGDLYEQGALVSSAERQWSHDREVLLVHPEEQTDSFILNVKAAMLLSKVKEFNLRFRSKCYIGDLSVVPAFGPNGVHSTEAPEANKAPAFIELDRLVSSFKPSFPHHFKDPVANGMVDTSLYTACTTACLAAIILHEPHAMVGRATCIHSCKILIAARTILDLLYSVSATSFDLSLLGLFPMICWFMAGRVLVRFLRASIESKSDEHCSTLEVEVHYIRAVIARVGEQIPLAHRYSRLLQDFLLQNCGEQYVKPISTTVLPPRTGGYEPDEENRFYVENQAILDALLSRSQR